jgi:acyl phosphate:glycerol-3-phosphate acyltransferase
MEAVLLIVGAYLLGSVPFGLMIAKAHGKDLRAIGSGNIGATNVSRALGKKWAYICFVLDVLKGAVPMLVAMKVLGISENSAIAVMWVWILVGSAAVMGHIFPLYLKFKGGKGAATSLGVGFGLWPYYTIAGVAAFAIWAIGLMICRWVSLASLIAGLIFPVIVVVMICLMEKWHFANLYPIVVMAFLIPLLLVVRHRDNIKRIIAGTEPKIGTE